MNSSENKSALRKPYSIAMIANALEMLQSYQTIVVLLRTCPQMSARSKNNYIPKWGVSSITYLTLNYHTQSYVRMLILCTGNNNLRLVSNKSSYCNYSWSLEPVTLGGTTLISMAKCKTAVTPLLTHWCYCSLALSHRYHLGRCLGSTAKKLAIFVQRAWKIWNAHLAPSRFCEILQ